MTDVEMAIDWIRSQGWNEENLPSDELLQMEQAFLAGMQAGGSQWHDLRKDPEDLPRQGVELLVSVDGYTRTAMYSKETNSFTNAEVFEYSDAVGKRTYRDKDGLWLPNKMLKDNNLAFKARRAAEFFATMADTLAFLDKYEEWAIEKRRKNEEK